MEIICIIKGSFSEQNIMINIYKGHINGGVRVRLGIGMLKWISGTQKDMS